MSTVVNRKDAREVLVGLGYEIKEYDGYQYNPKGGYYLFTVSNAGKEFVVKVLPDGRVEEEEY